MARRYGHSRFPTGRHCINKFRIPCGYNNRFSEWISFKLVYSPAKLINKSSVTRLPTSPLYSVNISKISPLLCELIIFLDFSNELSLRKVWYFAFHHSRLIIFIWPFVPDMHIVVYKIFNIRISSYKPEKFMDYPAQEYLFRCKQRKSFR